MYTNIFKRASDLVNTCENAYVAVVDPDGYPSVATRTSIGPKGLIGTYFATGTYGHMVEAIKKNSKASVCFNVENNNITLIGECEIIHDQALKETLWLDWFINHFPDGVDDEGYTLVKFTSKRVSLWVDRQGYRFDIDDITKVTSRCGLTCNHCECKEPHNCKGCIASNGHPFYGECPLAICAQDRGLNHCGECRALPCDLMNDYSCGDSEHADSPKGARIDMVKMWKEFGVLE